MVIVVRCAAPSRGSSLYSRDTVISQVCPFEQLDLWHLILLSLESFTITQWWTETKNEPYLIPCTCTPPEENICKYCKRKKSIFSAPTQTPPRRSKTWEAETTFDGSTDIRSCSLSRLFQGILYFLQDNVDTEGSHVECLNFLSYSWCQLWQKLFICYEALLYIRKASLRYSLGPMTVSQWLRQYSLKITSM